VPTIHRSCGANNGLHQFRTVPLNLDQANISSSGGPTYNKAYLNELKASNSSRPALTSSGSYDADVSMDIDDMAIVDESGKRCTHLVLY
jgi:GC-rich sequence DNA-binding factor